MDALLHAAEHLLHHLFDICLDMAPWLLLGFALAFVCSYFLSERWMHRHLGGPGWWPIFKASVFGLPLPICSCGVLLVGLALRKSGARKAPVCAFLASTPQSGTDALLVSLPLIGPVFTVLRFICAVLSGIVAGAFVRWFGIAQPPPHETEDLDADCSALCACHHHDPEHPHEHGEHHHHEFASRVSRFRDAVHYAFVHLPGEIALLLGIGILVAAALETFLPEHLLENVPLVWAYLLAIVIGLPTYACSIAIVPIAASLLAAGVSPGAVFVFMACAPTTHIGALLILGRELGVRTVVWFCIAVVLVAVLMGLAIDSVPLDCLHLPMSALEESHEHAHEHGLIGLLCLIPVVLILLNGLLRTRHHHHEAHAH